MEDSFSNTYYIHIPKTGGTTLNQTMERKYKTCIPQYHNHDSGFPVCLLKDHRIGNDNVLYIPDKRYIITIRNPISRFISAFHHMMGLKGKLKKRMSSVNISNINQLCSFIEKSPEQFNNHIEECGGHMKYGIHKYLTDFVHKCPAKDIVVIITEQFNHDCLNKLGITIDSVRNQGNYNRKIISESNKIIMKKYLQNDYDINDTLLSKDIISKEEYDTLLGGD